MIFWVVLKLEINSYRVIIMSWRILVSFRGFFEDYNFCVVKYLSFHNSSFALRYFFNVNGKAIVWHTFYSVSERVSRLQTSPPPTWLHVLINEFRVCHTFLLFLQNAKMKKFHAHRKLPWNLFAVHPWEFTAVGSCSMEYCLLSSFASVQFLWIWYFSKFDSSSLPSPLWDKMLSSQNSAIFFYCPKLVDTHV